MTGNQAVYTMFNIKTFIHTDRIILLWDQIEDPGLSNHHFLYFSHVVMEIYIDPMCIGMWLCSYHIVATLCILSWL
jgi:hypothetical protein